MAAKKKAAKKAARSSSESTDSLGHVSVSVRRRGDGQLIHEQRFDVADHDAAVEALKDLQADHAIEPKA